MINFKRSCRVICLVLCVSLLALALASCAEKKTKDGRFDYFKSKMNKFVLVSPEHYTDMIAKLPSSYLVTDDVVDSYIKNLLFTNKKELNGGQSVVDQPIKYGDTAYIFYEGFVDGVTFAGGSNMTSAPADPYALSIGSKSFIDNFEEQLIGVIPNQTSQDNRISVKVTFPEVYSKNPDMAGKEAEFLVYVVRVVQYEVPEYSNDTIKNVLGYIPSGDETNLKEEYKVYVKKNLEAANMSGIQNAVVNNLLDQLMDKVTFKQIPQSELDFYRDQYISGYKADMEYYTGLGYKFDDLDDFICQYLGLDDGADWESFIRDIYTEIIKKHLVCHAIAQIEGVKLTDEDYEAEIQYYIDQSAYEQKTLTRADVIETVGEYTIRENAMYSKICSMLYDNVKSVIYE